jgi:hypothetical protein
MLATLARAAHACKGTKSRHVDKSRSSTSIISVKTSSELVDAIVQALNAAFDIRHRKRAPHGQISNPRFAYSIRGSQTRAMYS